MPRRNGRAIVRLVLAGLVWAGVGAAAHAHRLEADYRVLPGRKVQVESWFDVSGESPRGATVQVFRDDGQLLAEGTLDDAGLFLFTYEAAVPLHVVVAAGAGHRKELVIPADALRGVAEGNAPVATAREASEPGPFADRASRVSVKDVLVGVAFLLAVAAIALSLRNARTLARLRAEKELRGDKDMSKHA